MVIQASIYRAEDGLALSASTDVDQRPGVAGCQKYIKLVSKRLAKLPDKCSLHLEGFNIHHVTALNLGFLVLCEDSYPTVLSFSFLDEIQKEFLVHYDSNQVLKTRRPYAFIEFDTYLQKTKQRYNKPRSLATRVNLADMTLELKLRPAYVITESDLSVNHTMNGNGFVGDHKTTYRPTVSPDRRLVPVDWVGMLSVVLSVVGGILNITRGMTIIGHGHFDEDDAGAYRFGATFLLAAVLSALQIYQIFHFSSWRRVQCLLLLFFHGWCNYILADFRNTVQILFHMGVALFATVVTLRRQLTEKLPGYSV